MTCGIYEIKNTNNDKKYIGYSKNIENRVKRHFRKLSKNLHENFYLQNAWNKYGEKCFKYLILEEVETYLLKEKEIEYIKSLNTKYPNGYNLTNGGDGIVNLDEVSKNKIRDAQLGNKNRAGAILSQETKNKISIGNKGKKISEKRKKELSDGWMADKNPNWGKTMKKSSKIKLSRSLKGHIPWNKGKKMSEDARKNMSESAKKRKKGTMKQDVDHIIKIEYTTPNKMFVILKQNDVDWKAVFGEVNIWNICKYDETLFMYDSKNSPNKILKGYYVIHSVEKLEQAYRWLRSVDAISSDEMKFQLKKIKG